MVLNGPDGSDALIGSLIGSFRPIRVRVRVRVRVRDLSSDPFVSRLPCLFQLLFGGMPSEGVSTEVLLCHKKSLGPRILFWELGGRLESLRIPLEGCRVGIGYPVPP